MEMIRDAIGVEGEIISRYRARTAGSRARHDEARKFMPAGDTRAATFFSPYPTYMAAGEGAWLIDCDGNRYLDFLNNYTSLVHGHAQPSVVELSADQLTRGTVFGTAAEPQVALARLLVKRVPSFDLVRFTNSGTEATMMMMRAARAYTGRDVIIKIDGGYHGSHDFVEVSTSADTSTGGPLRPRLQGRGIPSAVLNAVMIAPFNDLAAMADLLRQHHERIAGIIIEPIPNSGGIIPPAPAYLRGLRQLADDYGVLLLFDEIVTLRLSNGGYQQIEEVTPDMTAVAKIIGGGFPVGAFGGRHEIMQLFDLEAAEDSLFHSGTFNGNNMTMTAGLEAMRRLDEAAIARINRLGERLRDGLNRLFEAKRIQAQCLGYGSLQQIHWTAEPVVTLADTRRASADTGRLRELLQLELLNHGVYTSNRGLFSMSTPMSDADIDLALSALDAALTSLKPYMREVAPRLLAR